MERLDKLIAATGRFSRREVKALVRSGRVTVDGRPAARPEEKADPETACIAVDGEQILWRRATYIMMNKPAGLLSATRDGRGDGTVLGLLPPELRRQGLFPVGRLDRDTVGLLLLTNDGGLAHDLLSPKRHVDKTYFVRVAGTIVPADQAAFAGGLVLGDGLRCLPAALAPGETADTAVVTLHEGKFHQIKRMFAARGKPVLYLRRISMGPLSIDETLAEGEYRYLSEEETALLQDFRHGSSQSSK